MTDERGHDFWSDVDATIDDLPDSVDRAAVERMRAVAYVLDESVPVPGTDYRVGVDPLVSAVPVVGDALSAGLALYVVLEATRLGVPYTTVVEMLANVAVDAAGGSLPYVGDLFDAVWKANKRNLELVLDDLTDGADDAEEWTTVEVTSE